MTRLLLAAFLLAMSAVTAQAQAIRIVDQFSDLSGSATCAQLPALTGPVFTSAGGCATSISLAAPGPIGEGTPSTVKGTTYIASTNGSVTVPAYGDAGGGGGVGMYFGGDIRFTAGSGLRLQITSGAIIPTVDFYPNSTGARSLGLSTNRFKQLFLGDLANVTPLSISGYSLTGSNTSPLSTNAGTVNTSGVIDGVRRLQITNTAVGAGSFIDAIYGGAAGATKLSSLDFSGNYTVAGVYTSGAAVGLSTTKTVRASGGAADCTLIYTGGLLTGGTC